MFDEYDSIYNEIDQELFLQRCKEYGTMYMMWWYFCGEHNQNIEGAKFKIGQLVYVKPSHVSNNIPHIAEIKGVNNAGDFTPDGGDIDRYEYAISGGYWFLLWEDELEAVPLSLN